MVKCYKESGFSSCDGRIGFGSTTSVLHRRPKSRENTGKSRVWEKASRRATLINFFQPAFLYNSVPAIAG